MAEKNDKNDKKAKKDKKPKLTPEQKMKSMYSEINARIMQAAAGIGAKTVKDYTEAMRHVVEREFRLVKEGSKKITLDLTEMMADAEKMLGGVGQVAESARAIRTSTFIDLQSNLKFAEGELDKRIREFYKEYAGKPVSMYEVRDALVKEFQADGITNVTYKNKVKYPLAKYSMMVARTTRSETANITAIAQAKELGTDLIYAPPAVNGCKICIARTGRVYSISGKDKRFPPLTDLFPTQYMTIHPNCRCPIVPWFEEQYSDKKIEAYMSKSNRKEKVSSDNEVLKRYIKEQDYNRKVIEDQRKNETEAAKKE